MISGIKKLDPPETAPLSGLSTRHHLSTHSTCFYGLPVLRSSCVQPGPAIFAQLSTCGIRVNIISDPVCSVVEMNLHVVKGHGTVRRCQINVRQDQIKRTKLSWQYGHIIGLMKAINVANSHNKCINFKSSKVLLEESVFQMLCKSSCSLSPSALWVTITERGILFLVFRHDYKGGSVMPSILKAVVSDILLE